MPIQFKYQAATAFLPPNEKMRSLGRDLVAQQLQNKHQGQQAGLDRAFRGGLQQQNTFNDANSNLTTYIQDALENGDLDPQSAQELQGLQAGRMTVLTGDYNQTEQQEFLSGYNRRAAGILSSARRKPKPTRDDELKGFLGPAYDDPNVRKQPWVPDGKGGFSIADVPQPQQPMTTKQKFREDQKLSDYWEQRARNKLTGGDDSVTLTPEQEKQILPDALRMYEERQAALSDDPAPTGAQQASSNDVARYPRKPPAKPTGKFDERGYAIMDDGSKADPRDEYQMKGDGSSNAMYYMVHPDGTPIERDPNARLVQYEASSGNSQNAWAEVAGEVNPRSFEFGGQPDVADWRDAPLAGGQPTPGQALGAQRSQAPEDPRRNFRIKLPSNVEGVDGELVDASGVILSQTPTAVKIRLDDGRELSLFPNELQDMGSANQGQNAQPGRGAAGAQSLRIKLPGNAQGDEEFVDTSGVILSQTPTAVKVRLHDGRELSLFPSELQVMGPASQGQNAQPGRGASGAQGLAGAEPERGVRDERVRSAVNWLRKNPGKRFNSDQVKYLQDVGLDNDALQRLQDNAVGQTQLRDVGLPSGVGRERDLELRTNDLASKNDRAEAFLAGKRNPYGRQVLDPSGPYYRGDGMPSQPAADGVSLSEIEQGVIDKSAKKRADDFGRTDVPRQYRKGSYLDKRQDEYNDMVDRGVVNPKYIVPTSNQVAVAKNKLSSATSNAAVLHNNYRAGGGRLSFSDWAWNFMDSQSPEFIQLQHTGAIKGEAAGKTEDKAEIQATIDAGRDVRRGTVSGAARKEKRRAGLQAQMGGRKYQYNGPQNSQTTQSGPPARYPKPDLRVTPPEQAGRPPVPSRAAPPPASDTSYSGDWGDEQQNLAQTLRDGMNGKIDSKAYDAATKEWISKYGNADEAKKYFDEADAIYKANGGKNDEKWKEAVRKGHEAQWGPGNPFVEPQGPSAPASPAKPQAAPTVQGGQRDEVSGLPMIAEPDWTTWMNGADASDKILMRKAQELADSATEPAIRNALHVFASSDSSPADRKAAIKYLEGKGIDLRQYTLEGVQMPDSVKSYSFP